MLTPIYVIVYNLTFHHGLYDIIFIFKVLFMPLKKSPWVLVSALYNYIDKEGIIKSRCFIKSDCFIEH